MIEDARERGRALDPSASFIVQAPAGSGKTELLIQRFLGLLAHVDVPEAIVAITFTRKAAGEMRARVLEALRVAAGGVEPDAPHERITYGLAVTALARDRELAWRLLENPARLRIETIDALCAFITRQMPWVARFGAPPEISEKADDLYREAARNTLARVAEEEREGALGALSELLLHLDNDFAAAERLIAQMLETRDQWLRHVRPSREELEAALDRLVASELRQLGDCFDDRERREIAALLEFDEFPAPQSERMSQWTAIADMLLTNDGKWRKRVNFLKDDPRRQRCADLITTLLDREELRETLHLSRRLPPSRFEDSQWQAMAAALATLPVAVAELQLVFRERGRVDFSELSLRALDALGDVHHPTDLALALGFRIQHLLVDEFQDTSYTQYMLLEKLTAGWDAGDGRTLFLVGDPMQSIYRFRQAEVGLFLRAQREGVGGIALEPLRLRVNFRSEPSIVEWVNRTLANIFPQREDNESGAVAFAASAPGREAELPKGGVATHAFFDEAGEAEHVLSLVRDAGLGRTAILVRSRNHLIRIVAALERAGIRYQAIEIDQLGERPVIQDLMALTFALLHAADRTSWLAILRAPWCGLTLADLDAVAASEPYAAIGDLLRRPNARLSEDGRIRIERILPVLEEALAQRGRSSLRDWVQAVWMRLGGPACVAGDNDLEDAAAYFDLLESMDEGGDLHDFGWFRERVSALFAQPDSQAGDALQLMTIHKAKGLEFDTVILPSLGGIPRKDEERLLRWQEQHGELLLAPVAPAGGSADPIYDYLAKVERIKAAHETKRLLYVAATRARRKLHLLASVRWNEKEGGIGKPASGSFLNLLWESMKEQFIPAAPPREPFLEEQPRTIRRLRANSTIPAPPPSVTWTRRQSEPIETPDVAFEWVGDTLRHVGSALHGYLQRIAREGLTAWNEAAVRSRRPAYRTALANFGVAPAGLEGAAATIEKALIQMSRDPRGRWILGAHADSECEYAVTGLIEGRLYRAVIDRTFVDENGVRWIVDYKMSAHEGGDVDRFLDNEKSRYQEQLERYARLLAQMEERPIRLALYFPLLAGWREWDAPTLKRRQASLF